MPGLNLDHLSSLFSQDIFLGCFFFHCSCVFLFLYSTCLMEEGYYNYSKDWDKVTWRNTHKHTHTRVRECGAAGARSYRLWIRTAEEREKGNEEERSGSEREVWWWSENDFLTSSYTMSCYSVLSISISLMMLGAAGQREGWIKARVCVCVFVFMLCGEQPTNGAQMVYIY